LVRRLVPLAVGAFVLGMDAYVVAGLLPAVGSGLHCSVSGAGLMVTTFTLSYALLSPICATLAAGRPAKAVLLTALVVFCLGNACSALAPSLGVLLLARALAGLGAGVFIPVAAATAAGLATPARRDTRLLQSVILAVLAAALVTFPLLGRSQAGALIELFIWGAAGWASLAPQQHRLLARVPQFGTVAVSLNASALYLGSAAGSAAGGLLVASHGAAVECVALGCLAALFAVLNRVSTPAAAKQQVSAEDVAPQRAAREASRIPGSPDG
jgi:predicted MFS family arabinose efflux permease